MIRHAAATLLSTVLLAAGAIPSSAAVVEVLNCAAVTVGGQGYTRMNLKFTPPAGQSLDAVFVRSTPLPDVTDTCHVVEAIPPQHWLSQVDGGNASFYTLSELAIRYPDSLGGFYLTLSRPRSCVQFEFYGPLGMFADPIVCFESCGATPARPSSWGSLKAAYR